MSRAIKSSYLNQHIMKLKYLGKRNHEQYVDFSRDISISARDYPIIFKKFQDKGGGAAVDADEEVDAGQGYVRCARDVEDVGHGVHHGRHGPPEGKKKP